jgi:hypothetical protein
MIFPLRVKEATINQSPKTPVIHACHIRPLPVLILAKFSRNIRTKLPNKKATSKSSLISINYDIYPSANIQTRGFSRARIANFSIAIGP